MPNMTTGSQSLTYDRLFRISRIKFRVIYEETSQVFDINDQVLTLLSDRRELKARSSVLTSPVSSNSLK